MKIRVGYDRNVGVARVVPAKLRGRSPRCVVPDGRHSAGDFRDGPIVFFPLSFFFFFFFFFLSLSLLSLFLLSSHLVPPRCVPLTLPDLQNMWKI